MRPFTLFISGKISSRGDGMQTLYIDVYFLINFSVDLLSLHIASLFMKIKTSKSAIIISALIGALYAVILVLIPKNRVVFIIGAFVYFYVVATLMANGCRVFRKVKFLTAFLIVEIMIGGLVYFAYGALKRITTEEYYQEIQSERELIIFSLIILLSIGVLKLLLTFFKNNFSEMNVKLKLTVFDSEYLFDALVDSGNFLKDPMDLSPVMLIKPRLSKKIFPYGVPDISESGNVSEKMKQRIRVIPISGIGNRKILCGFRPDFAFVEKNGQYERINLTIAFDKEEGSFAGFDALIPYAALENI